MHTDTAHPTLTHATAAASHRNRHAHTTRHAHCTYRYAARRNARVQSGHGRGGMHSMHGTLMYPSPYLGPYLPTYHPCCLCCLPPLLPARLPLCTCSCHFNNVQPRINSTPAEYWGGQQGGGANRRPSLADFTPPPRARTRPPGPTDNGIFSHIISQVHSTMQQYAGYEQRPDSSLLGGCGLGG